MKALSFIFCLLIIASLLSSGCKQIIKSLEETFKPGDAAIKKQLKKRTGANTATGTTTTQRLERTEVIVNGDTLNTLEMQDQAKVLLKELETLQKNKNGNNSREIQNKVNEFLKNMHLPQRVGAKDSIQSATVPKPVF